VIIIPAIDIKNGNCVRLLQGDPDRETVYSSDPVAMALRFEQDGAELIHVVDLDGAFSGETVNRDIVKKIARSVAVPIEIGGGIRGAEAIEDYLEAGIRRIIIGTVILDRDFTDIINKYSRYIIAGIDARDSLVATHGWKKVSAARAIDVICELQRKGIEEVIYTDISTDGMLSGPNLGAMENILLKARGIRLIASGGISSTDDILALNGLSRMGLSGCITGKAIYDGRINLADAVRILKESKSDG
jgi:phosphoribosylformimino-5-aminoimidazole carboxamide ribotide isomerase